MGVGDICSYHVVHLYEITVSDLHFEECTGVDHLGDKGLITSASRPLWLSSCFLLVFAWLFDVPRANEIRLDMSRSQRFQAGIEGIQAVQAVQAAQAVAGKHLVEIAEQ